MQAPPTRLGQLFANTIRWMNHAGVVWIFALTFLICADITGRTVFALSDDALLIETLDPSEETRVRSQRTD